MFRRTLPLIVLGLCGIWFSRGLRLSWTAIGKGRTGFLSRLSGERVTRPLPVTIHVRLSELEVEHITAFYFGTTERAPSSSLPTLVENSSTESER